MSEQLDEHRVTQERVGTERRWLCSCGWASPWTVYTSAPDAIDAIRHELEHRNAGKDTPL